MNFLNFIRDESKRSIIKLYSATSTNLKDKSISEQINITNPFHKNNLDVRLKDREKFSENISEHKSKEKCKKKMKTSLLLLQN